MNHVRKRVAALVVATATLAACSDSNGPSFAELQAALQGCTQSSVGKFLQMVLLFGGLTDALEGTPPPNGVYDFDLAPPPAPANTYDFSIAFDSNSNAVLDTAIVGTATFSEDPTDGLGAGATIVITFDIQDSPVVAGVLIEQGTLTGSGDITATLGALPEEVSITGTISLDDSGCSAVLTFPVATPLNFVFEDTGTLEANTGFFEVFGTIEAFVQALGHELTAVLTLEEGTQTVAGTGDIDGTDVTVDYELVPPDEVLFGMLGSVEVTGGWIDFLADALIQIEFGVIQGAPPGVVITETADPNVYDYTIQLMDFDPDRFSAGQVQGRATRIFPELAGVAPSEVAFTWNVTGAVFSGGFASLSGQNQVGRPLRIYTNGGIPEEMSGAGDLDVSISGGPAGLPAPFDSVVSFDIPDNLRATSDFSSGTLLMRVVAGEDEMLMTIDLGSFITAAIVNDVPFFFGIL